MTIQERCQAGEAKLEQVSNALLDPRPEILNVCETNLQEVITLLAGEPPDSIGRPVVSDRKELLRLRHRVRMLAMQAQNAVNLCQGWTQLGLSQGYTDQGRPALPLSEPLASYEV
jgi:hypothetical protein